MTMQSLQEVQPNMDVFTADAVEIGRVKEIRDRDMLVDRDHARDVYIPLAFVNLVIDTDQRVELSITERDYNDHDWEHPPVL